MNKKISDDVLKVLQEARCEGTNLFINGQLDRKLYQETMKIIEMLGGKWSRGLRCHIFADDCEQAISLAIMTGQVADYKKQFQIFETPDKVADYMVNLADINPTQRILEPSAGRGAILKAIGRAMVKFKNKPAVYVCEMHDKNVEILARDFGLAPLSRDFLLLDDKLQFDRIVMNPPFRNGQDIAHVQKAYSLLDADGLLVALTYPSWEFRTEKKYADFRTWIENQRHTKEELPAGSFSESGTMIRTVLLTIEKS